MDPNLYTEEQKADIEDRVSRAKDLLIELNLQPAVTMQAENIGDDVFAMRPIPFLQDTKYSGVLSPIQNDELS